MMDSDNNNSSSSEHSPAPNLHNNDRGSGKDTDTVDPIQDTLVSEKSLDNWFNDAQLWVLVSKKDEYRGAGAKQHKELALKMGEMFATDMISSGVRMSESDCAALLDVCTSSRNPRN
jgi:hypothetical protein